MAKERMAAVAGTAVSLDEAMLVEQAKQGDMAAFGRLVARYQDRILNTCWRMCGSREDAEDITQEAFLRALESINVFQQRSAFYTWLYRIAVNLALSHRRKAARGVRLAYHGPDGHEGADHQAMTLAGRVSRDGEDPHEKLSARETELRVVEALDRLDADYRTVIVLRDIESLDYQQVAEILEVPVGTVKSRLHRGRLELRRLLGAVVSTRSPGTSKPDVRVSQHGP